MTQSKLYYDDAMDAFYMAEKHGVMYADKDCVIVSAVDFKVNYLAAMERRLPLRVCENSLPIFEPRAGDLIQVGDDNERYSAHMVFESNGELYIEDYGESYKVSPNNKIIQRDGKPFIWPKEKV